MSSEFEKLQARVMAGRDYGPRVVSFKDGPMAGEVHEVEAGWPCPSQIGEQLEDGTVVWYRIDTFGNATLIWELD